VSTPQQNNPAHAARYEELRRHAVERRILAGRLGLAVLLQQGLAAWVEEWTKMPGPTPAPSAERSRPSPLPDDSSADVIHVLAAMALSHMQEVRA
jgi:hypothetical protein